MAADRPTGDFGGKLRAARERRGISLRQIASTTRISVIALEALERNDLSRLPGGIFSRAFVRSYASEIGLDPEKTIEEFLSQFPHDSVTAGHPQASQLEDPELQEGHRRTASTFVRLLAVSVPIVGAVMYFGMSRSQATDPVPAPAPIAAAAAQPVPPPASFAGTPETTTLLPDAAPEAGVSPADAMDTATDPATEAVTDAAMDAVADAAIGGVLSVALLATRECWVSATVDGTKVIERILQAGERTSMEIQRELVLTLRDAAAISLTLNGSEVKPLGAEGQTVTTTLNRDNFRDYLSQ